MSDVLDRICAQTRIEIAESRARTPLPDLMRRAEKMPPPRGFIRSIRKKHKAGLPAVIAEIKKASPSRGVIRENFDPAAHAAGYQEAGAACLSVLTDKAFFQGSLDDLKAAREACTLPVLRKDFMLDPYQIVESRAHGADCVLLIMAALSDAQVTLLYDAACSLDMDVLVEMHDTAEVRRASELGLESALFGINNRNLKTLEVTLDTSAKLAREIAKSRIKVSESGIKTPEDIVFLHEQGYETFLIGEHFMSLESPENGLRDLLDSVTEA